MASASRAAYFPVSHRYQAFLRGLLPHHLSPPVLLQPPACTVSGEAPPTTGVPSFTPMQAHAPSSASSLGRAPQHEWSLKINIQPFIFMWQIFLK